MQEQSMILTFAPLVLVVLGFVAVVAAEIRLLKIKGWVAEDRVVLYPIVVGLINIPAALVASFIGGVIVMGLVFFVIPGISKVLGGDPNGANGGNEKLVLMAFIVVSIVVLFILYFTVFAVVRAVISLIMVRSSALTWKYWVGQAAVLAALFALVQALFVAGTVFAASSPLAN